MRFPVVSRSVHLAYVCTAATLLLANSVWSEEKVEPMTNVNISIPEFRDIAPPGGFVSAIVFHPQDPNLVYAGLDDSGGLYRSRDRGQTWEMLQLPRQNLSAWQVVLDPEDPDRIFIADCYGWGIFRSDDAGVHWKECNVGLEKMVPHRLVRGITIDPQDPTILHAGTKGDGVYRSTDRGEQWTKANSGLPDNAEIYRFARPATASFPLYAGINGGTIYRTVDGLEWKECVDLFPGVNEGEFWDLVVAPSNPDWIIAGMSVGKIRVMLSKNGGEDWEQVGDDLFEGVGGMPVGATFAFDPKNENVFYAAAFVVNGNSRRYRTDDGGKTFEDITGDMGRESVFRLAVSPHDSNLVIAGLIGEGIHFSPDRGKTWQRHSGRPSYPNAPGGFAVSPSDPSRIYIAGCMQNIVRTDDGGKSWKRLATPEWTLRLLVHPTDPDFVLAAPLHLFSKGLLRSKNGGESWEKIGPLSSGVTAAAFDLKDPNIIYATTFSQRGGEFGVFRSKDSGDSFERLSPDDWTSKTACMAVEQIPNGDGKLLITTTMGLYVSDEAQTAYTLVGLEGKTLFGLDVAASGLWVAGGIGEVYVSPDFGKTWKTHALPGCNLFPILIDEAANDRILLGPSASDVNSTPDATPGLFVSEDRGVTFTEITQGLYPSDQVYWIEKAGRPDTYLFTLYSSAGGLYEFTLPATQQ